jgi:8-oxo-dGTP diphosphatase
MQNYSLGFLFSYRLGTVILIEKTKPQWQKGLWNGVGGKIEEGETPIDCMRREFEEETGIYHHSWNQYLTLSWDKATVNVFWAISPELRTLDCNHITNARTMTDEVVSPVSVAYIMANQVKCIDNLQYLIPLAIQSMENTNNKHS